MLLHGKLTKKMFNCVLNILKAHQKNVLVDFVKSKYHDKRQIKLKKNYKVIGI